MKGKIVSMMVVALMLFGAFTVLINTGTENVKAVSDEGLVAYWDFDEGTGTILHDKSGNGNDGTIYGATWVDGVKGKALSFDGKDDYVEVPSSDTLNITANITIVAWVYIMNGGTIHPRIISKIASPSGYPSADEYGYELGINSTAGKVRHIRLRLADGEHYGSNYKACGANITEDKWFFVVAGRDGNSEFIYINGQLIDTATYPYPIKSNSNSLRIGMKSMPSYDAFSGYIDEVRIYNRALSAEEIQALYNEIAHPSQSGGSTPGFEVAYFIGALFASSAMLYYKRRKP